MSSVMILFNLYYATKQVLLHSLLTEDVPDKSLKLSDLKVMKGECDIEDDFSTVESYKTEIERRAEVIKLHFLNFIFIK